MSSRKGKRSWKKELKGELMLCINVTLEKQLELQCVYVSQAGVHSVITARALDESKP